MRHFDCNTEREKQKTDEIMNGIEREKKQKEREKERRERNAPKGKEKGGL